MSENKVKEESTLIEDNEVDFVSLIEQPAWKTILLDIVRKEKIDVWNVDIALLAKKYLEKIQSMQSKNLRVPANAILCCAILLKTKSNTLRFPSLEQQNELSKEEIIRMNELLPELIPNARMREELITLDELVESIEEIIAKTKTREKQRIEIKPIEFNFNLIEEDIDSKITKVLNKIKERMDSERLTTFSELLDEITSIEIVNTFIPLLFLMNKGKILMWQESIFGEIFISLLED
jgi:segregation and condensation protein A